jgi:hypothetical protein
MESIQMSFQAQPRIIKKINETQNQPIKTLNSKKEGCFVLGLP